MFNIPVVARRTLMVLPGGLASLVILAVMITSFAVFVELTGLARWLPTVVLWSLVALLISGGIIYWRERH